MNSYSRTSTRSPGTAYDGMNPYETGENDGNSERAPSRNRTPSGRPPSRPASAGSAVGAPLSWRIESTFAANFLDEPAEQIPSHNTPTVSYLIRRGRAEEAPVSGVQTVATPGAIGKVLLRTRDKREVFLLWEMAETDGQAWYGLRLTETNIIKNENPIKILKKVPNLEYDVKSVDPWVLFGQVPEEDPEANGGQALVILAGNLKCFYCQAEAPGPYGTVAEWHFDPATLARLCETCKFGLLSFLLNRDSHIKILNVQIERLNTEKRGLENRMDNSRDNALVSTLRKRVHNMLKENEELKSNLDIVVARETDRVITELKTTHSTHVADLDDRIASLSAQVEAQQREMDDLRRENQYHVENARLKAEQAMQELAEENRVMRERQAEVERALVVLGGVIGSGTQGILIAGAVLPPPPNGTVATHPHHAAAAAGPTTESFLNHRNPAALVSPPPENDVDNDSLRGRRGVTNGLPAGKRKTATQLERDGDGMVPSVSPRLAGGRPGRATDHFGSVGSRPKSGVY